jgi:hypothetical protein
MDINSKNKVELCRNFFRIKNLLKSTVYEKL